MSCDRLPCVRGSGQLVEIGPDMAELTQQARQLVACDRRPAHLPRCPCTQQDEAGIAARGQARSFGMCVDGGALHRRQADVQVRGALALFAAASPYARCASGDGGVAASTVTRVHGSRAPWQAFRAEPIRLRRGFGGQVGRSGARGVTAHGLPFLLFALRFLSYAGIETQAQHRLSRTVVGC